MTNGFYRKLAELLIELPKASLERRGEDAEIKDSERKTSADRKISRSKHGCSSFSNTSDLVAANGSETAEIGAEFKDSIS